MRHILLLISLVVSLFSVNCAEYVPMKELRLAHRALECVNGNLFYLTYEQSLTTGVTHVSGVKCVCVKLERPIKLEGFHGFVMTHKINVIEKDQK